MNSDKTPKETHEKLKFSKKIHFIRTVDFSPISRRHWNSSKTEFWSGTPSALRNNIIYLLDFFGTNFRYEEVPPMLLHDDDGRACFTCSHLENKRRSQIPILEEDFETNSNTLLFKEQTFRYNITYGCLYKEAYYDADHVSSE